MRLVGRNSIGVAFNTESKFKFYTVKNGVCLYTHLRVFKWHPSVTSHLKVYNNTFGVFNYTSTCLVFDDTSMGHLDTPLGVKHNSPE